MNDYSVIDVETSGIYAETGEIIRLSALKVVGGKITEKFDELVKPEKPIPKAAEALTGITEKSLETARPLRLVLSELLTFVGSDVLVAHNVGFDIKFLRVAAEKLSMPPIKNKTADTLALAKSRCKAEKFSLRAVAKFLGIDYKGLTDCEIVFHVYEKLKNMRDLSWLEDNANRFYRDGKIFLKKIDECRVIDTLKKGYLIYCKIPECGADYYIYSVDIPAIKIEGKGLWLEETALDVVNGAIEKYERVRDDIRTRHTAFHVAEWKTSGLTIYYEYSDVDKMQFNVYAEVNGVECKIVKYAYVETIFAMVKKFTYGKSEAPRHGKVVSNPLYRSALKYNDRRLIAELKFVYGTPSKEDLAVLESVDGIRRLPRLSEDYNTNYVLDYDEQAIAILNMSRYKFCHRPGFAMMNCTRSKILVNPYTKYAVDAAHVNYPSMTFVEYLKLFD